LDFLEDEVGRVLCGDGVFGLWKGGEGVVADIAGCELALA
jgi:hypothetical protein